MRLTRESKRRREGYENKNEGRKNTSITFFVAALGAGALKEQGDDLLHVCSRGVDGGLESFRRNTSPAESFGIGSLPQTQRFQLVLHSCTGAKERESKRNGITREGAKRSRGGYRK